MQWAAEQGAVFVEDRRRGCARNIIRAAARRTGSKPSTARCTATRAQRRRVRRLDPRQDRDRGRGCGRVPRSRLLPTRSRRLPVGKARYGLMLREDGFVMDDGTTSRLAPERFFMTTTTAQAGRVMQHLEFCHQVLWPAARRADGVGVGAMGAVLRSRGRARATCCASSSTRNSISPTRPSRISPRRRSRSRAASRRGCFASRSRARWPTSWRFRRATATPRSAPSWRRARNSASRPTAPRRSA